MYSLRSGSGYTHTRVRFRNTGVDISVDVLTGRGGDQVPHGLPRDLHGLQLQALQLSGGGLSSFSRVLLLLFHPPGGGGGGL